MSAWPYPLAFSYCAHYNPIQVEGRDQDGTTDTAGEGGVLYQDSAGGEHGCGSRP